MRRDGYRIYSKDPMSEIIPYIMPKRYDASNSIKVDIDLEIIQDYTRKCRKEGKNVSHMAIIICAYLRLVSQNPLLNRFVMNKKIYTRNHFCVSFVTLKKGGLGDTVSKLYFDLDDDIFTVSDKLNATIEQNQKSDSDNSLDRIMSRLISIPFLLRTAIGVFKVWDIYVGLPFKLIHASPFHTSLFVTNLASIRTDTVYHHLYEFGTTGIFVSMGQPIMKVMLDSEGKPYQKKVMRIGIVTDERIASGHYFGRCFRELRKYLENPEVLEEKPKTVVHDPEIKKKNPRWISK